ncbi:MAG: hypothetical protein JXA82_15575 [Sedimentisphaerales bacterium]|nr:hypothetical protein [Sedimentisphaerales bacterium]
MNRKISHLIITRYNLSLFSDKTMQDKIRCSPEEWMEKRFELFSRFTLPSMAGQTCQDFTWYLFFDRNTPTEYVRPVEDLAGSNMRIIRLTIGQTRFLLGEVQQANDIVITGRIDNDDAWHKDFIRIVQQRHAMPTRLVEMPQCYWLDLQQGRLYHQRWRWYYRLRPRVGNNPSLVEWRQEAKTIQAANHTQLLHQVRWRQFKLETQGTFRLIICHSDNLINKIDRTKFLPVDMNRLEDFNVQTGLAWMRAIHEKSTPR